MSKQASRAFVIGVASGIGWAVAAEGCHVTIADRNADGATDRARELGAAHDAANVDVTDEASVAALFDTTGTIDVVVNTAGFGGFGRITEQPVEDVAEAVLFLCSDKASWRTGEVLDLNGGAHLKRYPDVLAHVDRMASA